MKGVIYMKILDERGLSGIVKRFLDLILLGGIAIVLALPVLLNWYMDFLQGYISEKYWFLLPFLYITGALAILIVNELRRIFKTLNRRDPFRRDNVKSFERLSACCFAIAFFYCVKIFVFNSFLTIILFMVFIIGGFFLLILAEIFRQAVAVKEENDLTI